MSGWSIGTPHEEHDKERKLLFTAPLIGSQLDMRDLITASLIGLRNTIKGPDYRWAVEGAAGALEPDSPAAPSPTAP